MASVEIATDNLMIRKFNASKYLEDFFLNSEVVDEYEQLFSRHECKYINKVFVKCVW